MKEVPSRSMTLVNGTHRFSSSTVMISRACAIDSYVFWNVKKKIRVSQKNSVIHGRAVTVSRASEVVKLLRG